MTVVFGGKSQGMCVGCSCQLIDAIDWKQKLPRAWRLQQTKDRWQFMNQGRAKLRFLLQIEQKQGAGLRAGSVSGRATYAGN